MIGQDPVVGLSIASEDGQPYFIPVCESITEGHLKSWIRDILRKAKQVAVMDFKNLLYQLGGMEETGNVFDLGIAGYLLNPLKDTYNYDDIARDYLGQTLPSRVDLFGKVPAESFYPSRDEVFFNYAAYLSWIPESIFSHEGSAG